MLRAPSFPTRGFLLKSKAEMKTRILSLLALLLFALLSSARDVLAKELFNGKNVDPIFFIVVGSFVTLLVFYWKISFNQWRVYVFDDVLALKTSLKRRLVWLNIATLVAFGTTMLAIDRLNAYTNAVIDYGASPLVATALAVWLTNDRPTKVGIVGLVLSLFGVVILAQALVNNTRNSVPGITLAIISCLAMTWGQVLAKILLASGMSRDRLMVNRLVLLLVVFGLWCFYRGTYHLNVNIFRLILVCILGITVPLYLMFTALEKLQVKDTSLAFFLIPVFTFFGTWAKGHFESRAILPQYVLAGILVLGGVFIAESSYAKQVKEKPNG